MFRFGQPELYSLEEKIGDCDEPQLQPRGSHYERPFPATLSCTILVREIEDAYCPEWRLRRYVSALLQNMIQAALPLFWAPFPEYASVLRRRCPQSVSEIRTHPTLHSNNIAAPPLDPALCFFLLLSSLRNMPFDLRIRQLQTISHTKIKNQSWLLGRKDLALDVLVACIDQSQG